MQPRQKLFLAVLACILGLLVGTALVLTVGSSKAKAQTAAKVTLNPEISLGGAFSTSHVAAPGTTAGSVDLGEYGFLYGAGVGVGLQTNMFIVEPFGRYSFMHDGGKLPSSGASFTSPTASNLVDAGARIGFRATKATNVYGILGYAWEDLSLPKLTSSGSANHSPSGFELGAGVEHALFSSPLYVRAEYTHEFFDVQDIPGLKGMPALRVTPDLNVVRVGLVYKFGTGASAPNLFDTSKLAPEAEGCDSKLANCHHPLK